VEPKVEAEMDTLDLVLYKVPNYKTKLNLLNMLLADAYQFPKIIVYANTRTTAESLYKSLNKRIVGEVALWNPKSTADLGFWSIEEFENTHEIRVLIVANEESPINSLNTPYLLHFDLPESKELYIERIQRKENDQRMKAITFATDIELTQVSKIELAIGKKIPVEELPIGLIVEGDRKSHKNDSKEEPKTEEERGSAFHQKKASNAKDYNLKYKDRLKMFGKKHRKNKRGE
jgi:ATP-dependent RNA helicase RhlE